MGDRIAVMSDGVLQQLDTPENLHERPVNVFVAGFIGSPSMNFIPCRLEAAGEGLRVRLTDNIAFAVPASRVARYQPHVGSQELMFGIRPEHLTEAKPNGEKNIGQFDAALEVTEPMGNETMVFFSIDGTEVCGRVSPNAGARESTTMRMAVALDNMHLIDNASGRVL